LRISQWEIQKGNIFFGEFLKPIQGCLIGGLELLEHYFFSIIYGIIPTPLTNSYFSRWLKPPIRYTFVRNNMVLRWFRGRRGPWGGVEFPCFRSTWIDSHNAHGFPAKMWESFEATLFERRLQPIWGFMIVIIISPIFGQPKTRSGHGEMYVVASIQCVRLIWIGSSPSQGSAAYLPYSRGHKPLNPRCLG